MRQDRMVWVRGVEEWMGYKVWWTGQEGGNGVPRRWEGRKVLWGQVLQDRVQCGRAGGGGWIHNSRIPISSSPGSQSKAAGGRQHLILIPLMWGWGTSQVHLGCTSGTSWLHLRQTWSTHQLPLVWGCTSGTSWVHFGYILGKPWVHFGYTSSTFGKTSLKYIASTP